MQQQPTIAALPPSLPIFPLAGVLLLPGGELPLNIFEPRYLSMVDDALSSPTRLIGMVQPRPTSAVTSDIYPIGCAGRITSFTETDDGRYLVTLKGISRFNIESEQPCIGSTYRRITPNWAPYKYDLAPHPSTIAVDRSRLNILLKSYFRQQGLSCDWAKVELTGDVDLLTALAMICPLAAAEKQAILEAPTLETRTDIFLGLLEMAITDPASNPCECEHESKCH